MFLAHYRWNDADGQLASNVILQIIDHPANHPYLMENDSRLWQKASPNSVSRTLRPDRRNSGAPTLVSSF
jgi:hypothetical protein